MLHEAVHFDFQSRLEIKINLSKNKERERRKPIKLSCHSEKNYQNNNKKAFEDGILETVNYIT